MLDAWNRSEHELLRLSEAAAVWTIESHVRCMAFADNIFNVLEAKSFSSSIHLFNSLLSGLSRSFMSNSATASIRILYTALLQSPPVGYLTPSLLLA